MFTFLLIFIFGCIAGIAAGLLGIGGGLVVVPFLEFLLPHLNIPHKFVMHIALGTSLASIIFTSISSFLKHHKIGAVNWDIWRKISVGIVIGTFLGACIASRMSTNSLKIIFIVFLWYAAFQMILDRKPNPTRTFPGYKGMFGVGGIIGILSSLFGIGGGTLSVPFMIWCNLPIHHAIGTASAIGLPIAIAGTAGYILNGIQLPDLPNNTVGFIYIPALIAIICGSVLTAPLGAKLAHSLPVKKLKQGFAIFLIFVGIRMLLLVVLR